MSLARRCHRIADNPALTLILAQWENSSGHPDRAAELLDEHMAGQSDADAALLALRAQIALHSASPGAEPTLQEWADVIEQQSKAFAAQAITLAEHLLIRGERSRAEVLLRLSARLQPDNPKLKSLSDELHAPAATSHCTQQSIQSLRSRALSARIHKFTITTSTGESSFFGSAADDATDLIQAGKHVLADATAAARAMHLGALLNVQLEAQRATVDMLVLDGRHVLAMADPAADLELWHNDVRQWFTSNNFASGAVGCSDGPSTSLLEELLAVRGVLAVDCSSGSQAEHICIGDWPVPCSHIRTLSDDIASVAESCCCQMHVGQFVRGQFFTPQGLLHIQSVDGGHLLCLADRSVDAERLDARVQAMFGPRQLHQETDA